MFVSELACLFILYCYVALWVGVPGVLICYMISFHRMSAVIRGRDEECMNSLYTNKNLQRHPKCSPCGSDENISAAGFEFKASAQPFIRFIMYYISHILLWLTVAQR